MDPLLLIKIHSIFALLSLLIYSVRGGLMLIGSAITHSKPFLASAAFAFLLLLVTGGAILFITERELTDSFVIHKIMGLIAYIIFGILAFKTAINNRLIGFIFWIIGLASFAYTYALAKKMVPLLF